MKILITGVCGFVGSALVDAFAEAGNDVHFVGIDNLSRSGSEQNRARLLERGVDLHHGDIRNAADFAALPSVDWVIDAAANPSVLAGVDGAMSTRQVVENNLYGTIEILEMDREAYESLLRHAAEASGKVQDTAAATSFLVVQALEAAGADGDIIEVLYNVHGDTANV